MNKKINGQSLNPQQELLAWLQKKLPEAFTEGKIDCKKLQATLGESVDVNGERYGLSWAGKNDCFRHIQEPTTATLKPIRDESVDFDTTKNLFIEGDNLQVLKVLQKSYYGQVKMIYIDPPYNSGTDSFIYPDRFQETQEEYMERVGDKEEGHVTRDGMWQKNSGDNGHYHSNWLSMMYPRLFLARNLLRDDGVICISIDDNEIHNLRCMLNEIFGEENFMGHIHWRRRHNQPNDETKMIGLVAEHILVFAKNESSYKLAGVGKLGLTGKFSNPDNDPRGDWASKPWKVGSDQSGSRYKIITSTGKEYDEEWMGDEENYKALCADKRIIFPDKGNGAPRKKYFKFEREKEGQCATNWWPHDFFGHNQEGNDEMTELFGIKNIFSNPKPTKLMMNLIRVANAQSNDLILDFFAGSCSTAQAVELYNSEEEANLHFICVQLPEVCGEGTEAHVAGFNTIADIGKQRLCLAAKKIQKETKKNIDYGFKVLKLDESNFKIWRSNITDAKKLAEQMHMFIDNLKAESTQENVLYELILKTGLDLNVSVESKKADGKKYYSLDGGKLVVCLEDGMSRALANAIIALKPEKVICLDGAFKDNDQLKTNTALQMEAAKIDFRVI